MIDERQRADEIDAIFPPPADRVDAVLDVACSVIADYGGSSTSTRIERLARWVLANLDACPTLEQTGTVAKFYCARRRSPEDQRRPIVVWSVGALIAVELEDGSRSEALSAEDARELATALLRAAERSEV